MYQIGLYWLVRKPLNNLIPAQAGIHNSLNLMDLCLCGDDNTGLNQRLLS
jgi:hypothetical protein